MNRRLYLFIYLIFILSCFNIKAQIGKLYSTDSELSNSLINQLFQDERGFIWVATEFGLNKYDGYRFSNYIHQPDDNTTIKNNYVRTLFETSDQKLLVGCINGLMQYNRDTDSFQEIPLLREDKQVYAHVAQMCELHNGEIWISTSGQGIFNYNKTENKAYSINHIMERLDYYYLNSIYEDSENNIWIGTENNGLIYYSPQTDRIQLFKYPDINDNNISSIIEDTHGNLLVGTQKNGLSRYDKLQKRFIPVKHVTQSNLSIYCLSMMDDRVLVGTDGQGMKIYNAHNQTLDDVKFNYAPINFSDGKIHSILQDKNKNLWIGLFQKGIVFLPQQTNPFQYFGAKSIFHNPIGESCVMSIYQDKKSNIWVGTDNEGLYEIDSQGERIRHYKPNTSENSVPNTIMSIFEDSEENLWLGSYSSGISQLNRKTGKCSFPIKIEDKKIFSVCEDKNKNLYIATYGSGFYKYNILSGELNHYESLKDEKNDLSANELANDWINYIFCDSDGLIWMGHYKGISCFNPETENFINFRGVNTLITNRVGYVIQEDRAGNIWAGTTDGLYYFNKRTEDLKRYSIEDGLPNNVICGISEDNDRNIWISTYMGLSKLDPHINRFSNYYASDGLQGNEFTHGAFYKGSQGNLYFGGTNGITYFTPQRIEPIVNDSRIWITDFYVSNKRVYKGLESGGKPIVYHPVMDANLFQLSHQDNTFTLVFSTLQYNSLEHVFYQYMIEELDNSWSITGGGENKVTYNNLPPGKYTFHVRTTNHGEFSEAHSIKIIISPPWYQTWWAYTIYIFIVFLILLGLYNIFRTRMLHKRELMKREHIEQLNEAKLQFFINISHEIRTPMSLIISPLEKLLVEKNNEEHQKTYAMIYRNAQRILRLINQLMDIRKIDKGQMYLKYQKTDIIEFIKDIMLTFEYPAQKKKIKFTFEHSTDSLDTWIDINNFDKVLMNVLSNAFKYTPDNGEIDIKLTSGYNPNFKDALKNYFEIRISDTGIGLDKNKIDRIFERFYQINNDVTQSNFGTGIGLHLCRSLVELHQGEIIAENRKDKQGSCFIIRIPLGCSHIDHSEIEHINQSSIITIPNSQEQSLKKALEVIDETTINNKKAKTKTNLRLLIVEDEDDIRDYLQLQLGEEYRINTCRNGKEAYDSILSKPPHIIISDVMMPEMDGLTLCRKIKQNININHIPVILLTAKSRLEDKVEGMEIGADAYCVKPFNIEILKSTITNLIQNRHLLQTKFSGVQEQNDKIQKIEIKTADEILMEKIMKTINDNISNPNLNVETLAQQVGISRVHIYRKLKELTNLSARDFIKNIRLKQSATLLMQKNLTISDIAYATGFTTLSHFSSSFKEMYGVSPTEYRLNNEGKEQTGLEDINTAV